MKVLATFDGSKCSEVILPQLQWMATIPEVEFTFLSVARPLHETQRRRPIEMPVVGGMPGTTPIALPVGDPQYVEDRGAAIARTRVQRIEYLRNVVGQMPVGPSYATEVVVAEHAAPAIIRYAMQHAPDVLVMGTHGETGMIHRLFGDVAEQVVRSGVAPVLLVHSDMRHRIPKAFEQR